MKPIRFVPSLAALLLFIGALAAQTQGNVVATAPTNPPNNTQCDVVPPADAESGTTVNVTKVEEQVVGGQWVDITNSVTRTNNPSAKVHINFGEVVDGKKFRFSFSTNKTLPEGSNCQVTGWKA